MVSTIAPKNLTPWLLLGAAIAVSLIASMFIRSSLALSVPLLVAGLPGLLYLMRRYNSLPVRLDRRFVVVVLVLGAAITLVRVLALAGYPEHLFVDEAWNTGFSMSFLRDGHLSDLTMERMTGNPAYSLSWFFPLPALWIGLTDASYWNLRLFHFVGINVPLITFTALAARNWFDTRTGWIVAAVLFVGMTAVHNAVIRHDGAVAVLIALALWLHTEALKRRQWWLHLLAGLVCGASVLVHLHGAAFAIASAVGLYGPHLVAARGERKRYLMDGAAFVVGCALAALVYYVFQYAPDQVNYARILDTRERPDIHPVEIVRRALMHMTLVVGWSVTEYFFVLTALVACLVRRRFADVKLFVWFTLMYLALGAVQTEIFTNYIRQMTPALALMVGSFLSLGLNRRPHPQRPLTFQRLALLLVALALVLGVNLGQSLRYVAAGGPLHLPPPPSVAWIREHLPADVKILAPSRYYFWLSGYEFTSTYYLWTTQRAVIKGPAIAEDWRMALADEHGPAVWDAVDADVVIYDNLEPPGAMVPNSLFESDYLASRGYRMVFEWTDGEDEGRVYVRGS